MVKSLNRSRLFFFFFSVVFLMSRSTSREQNLRAVNRLCAQNVTGLNPACDLCWMSYPRCIQSFQWLCCWVLHLGIHGIKMHACIGLGSLSAYYQYWVIRPCGRFWFWCRRDMSVVFLVTCCGRKAAGQETAWVRIVSVNCTSLLDWPAR